MEHLTGLDAVFLAMESPQEYLHIGSVAVLDPSTAPKPLTLERFTEHVASRLHLVPLMRRRLVPDLAQLAVWLGEELRLLSEEVVPTPALAG
jgi:hypothetical protein